MLGQRSRFTQCLISKYIETNLHDAFKLICFAMRDMCITRFNVFSYPATGVKGSHLGSWFFILFV